MVKQWKVSLKDSAQIETKRDDKNEKKKNRNTYVLQNRELRL